MSPPRRRVAVGRLEGRFGVSKRRACTVAGQQRTTQRYCPRVASDEDALLDEITRLVGENPPDGCRYITMLMQHAGWKINHKRVHRH